jgi:hypothetical protein
MKVHVVMGNDYPAAVFDDDKKAAAFVDKMKVTPENISKFGHPRIHWRAYEFELNKEEE